MLNLTFSKWCIVLLYYPHMDYASIVWGRCPNIVNNDRISKLQKRSARVILGCKIRDISSKDLFNTMN